MPKLIQVVAAAAIASLCASCATVTRGTTEQIQIVSDPPGAEARTSMGFVCVIPDFTNSDSSCSGVALASITRTSLGSMVYGLRWRARQ